MNPTFNEKTFSNVPAVSRGEAMTVQGTVNKTGFLLILTVLAASFTWRMYYSGDGGAAMPWAIGGAIIGFILAMVTCFKMQWAGVTAPLYAIFEGLFLGGISAVYEQRFHGIAIEAVMLTFGTLAAMLAAFTTGLIRATPNFTRGVIAATGGIALVYIASMILGFFGVHMTFLFSGTIGICFSLFVVVIAALNLVIDFDIVERGAQAGAPKYMEWYASFGLMVTLIWLYLELLRLLAQLNRRN